MFLRDRHPVHLPQPTDLAKRRLKHVHVQVGYGNAGIGGIEDQVGGARLVLGQQPAQVILGHGAERVVFGQPAGGNVLHAVEQPQRVIQVFGLDEVAALDEDLLQGLQRAGQVVHVDLEADEDRPEPRDVVPEQLHAAGRDGGLQVDQGIQHVFDAPLPALVAVARGDAGLPQPITQNGPLREGAPLLVGIGVED